MDGGGRPCVAQELAGSSKLAPGPRTKTTWMKQNILFCVGELQGVAKLNWNLTELKGGKKVP